MACAVFPHRGGSCRPMGAQHSPKCSNLPGIAPLMLMVAVLAQVGEVDALRCYRCALQPLSRVRGQHVPPCDSYDRNLHFVECPFSTFCMKRIIQWEILEGVWVNSTIRDCAKQLVPERVYQNGRLRMMYALDKEAYSEGCGTETHPLRATSTEYCFCQGDLCNSSNRPSSTLFPLLLATLLLWGRCMQW